MPVRGCHSISTGSATSDYSQGRGQGIAAFEANNQQLETNDSASPVNPSSTQKKSCFARIWAFLTKKKQKQEKAKKYDKLLSLYKKLNQDLYSHYAMMLESKKLYSLAKEKIVHLGNKEELMALQKDRREESCELQQTFNEYLKLSKDIRQELHRLNPKKHPISKRARPNILVRLGFIKEKKPLLSDYEIIQGKKILEAFKSHSAKLRVQEADELGIKKIIYEDQEKGGKKHLFFHQNKPIGYINFEKDKFTQNKSQAAKPQFKTIEYKNANSLFFSFKSAFTNNNKALPERKEVQLCRDANNRNGYFANCQHMYSAYYVKHDEKIGMIARVAGDINGAELLKDKISIPIRAFKKPLEELELLMEKHIYITDIKPDNMMIRQKQNGEYQVNFIDIDTHVFDLSRLQTQDERDYLSTFATRGFGEHHAHRIETERDLGSLIEARSLSKAKNYFAFLLCMYKLTKEREPGVKSYSCFSEWCKKAILPQYQSRVNNFRTYFEHKDCSIHNLSKMINWDYVVQQHN